MKRFRVYWRFSKEGHTQHGSRGTAEVQASSVSLACIFARDKAARKLFGNASHLRHCFEVKQVEDAKPGPKPIRRLLTNSKGHKRRD